MLFQYTNLFRIRIRRLDQWNARMENKKPSLILSTQLREALALILVIVFLIVITYLISVLIIRVLPFPFGSFENFSACCG